MKLFMNLVIVTKQTILITALSRQRIFCKKKYLFNDKEIYKMVVEKVIVPKGKEYIKFEIKTLTKKAQ